MSLKSFHRTMLGELVEAGHGKIDTSGRVCVGPINRPIQGDPVGWLVLVAHGLVAGEQGLIMPTEDGRQMASKTASGRVREAS